MTEFEKAKAYLLTSSHHSETNLYDHLSTCLKTLLQEKPKNGVDIFEEVSRAVKRERFTAKTSTLVDVAAPSSEAKLAAVHQALFVPSQQEDQDAIGEEDSIPPFPNLLEISSYFQQAGVGLGQEEVYRIFLALKGLTEKNKLEKVRFWGKIFGLQKNYIIAEGEFIEGEGLESEEDKGGEAQIDPGDVQPHGEVGEDNEEAGQEIPLPKPNYRPPPVIPKEELGTGTNKKVYFVCNDAGQPWTRLPSVTPVQILTARFIRKFFTGNLDAPVSSYPPFVGKEINYLRAQIARISATTHISPTSYFMFDGDDEDETDVRDTIIVNDTFETIRSAELIEDNLSRWVHHIQYILPQGRCTWFNPLEKPEDQLDDDDEDDEEKDEPDELPPEEGPPLLNPLSEDKEVDSQPSWSANLSSNLLPQYAIAVLQSNLWPGASTFCMQRTFENIYVGWGQKYSAHPTNPMLPPPVQEEYPDGPDILEADDPTVEQEALIRAAQEDHMKDVNGEEEPESDNDD